MHTQDDEQNSVPPEAIEAQSLKLRAYSPLALISTVRLQANISWNRQPAAAAAWAA